MNSRIRLWICLATVALLYVFHVELKTTKIFTNPTWSDSDEVGQFWSEFAVHYRFAKFFASHPVRDWGLLAHDTAIQHPDAINSWAEFTVMMEVPAGVLYRWLGGSLALPFHTWVVWYDCLVSSLTLFGVFFLARALWRSDLAGVMASALYAGLYPSYGRTVKNLFLKEDFAIPLIVFALFFTVRALQEAGEGSGFRVQGSGLDRVRGRETGAQRGVWFQVMAAVFWLAALASWHLTQFVLAVGVGAAVLVYLGKGETPRLPWFVLLMTVGAVAVPVLWMKQFYLSPTMCVLYALSLAVWMNGGRQRAGKVFVAAAVALVAVGLLLQKSYGEYAHVYQLFFYKLRYLGVKPVEAGRLSWEARCLWEGAFNTATWGEWWHSLWWCGPLAVVALARRMKWETANVIFVVFAILLVPLSWMVVRYFSFLGFAAAVVAAGLVTQRVWWKVAVAAAALWQLVMLNPEPLDRGPIVPEQCRAVARWLRQNTATNAVVLASISESPVWLAEAGRPVVLHSKFENRVIRERYREFLGALYGSERQLYRFARRYGAEYFVFDVGCLVPAPDSWRYKADKMGELPASCAARLLWEQPAKAQFFKPVMASPRFVVYRVLFPQAQRQ